ncbi:Uncharacterized protein TCM_013143 [Theobroma cacao]|uniref:Uncharacterized protein n=1 Tax=Theobroma cacao TaxID=3641 RepID=A0A061G392_THECC|nr:Uncharacterized protein TCM_013143 [Theobroma cacao]
MYAWLGHQMITQLRPLDALMSANIVEIAMACEIRWSEAPGFYYVVAGPQVLVDLLLETKNLFGFSNSYILHGENEIIRFLAASLCFPVM